MKKVKKHTYPPIHMGTSLMLVIFIILCLVIFAVLSLSSATKDSNYSQQNANRTTAYYTACNQAEQTVAQIDTILSQEPDLSAAVAQIEALGYVAVSEDFLAEFHVSIDDDEMLQVVLDIQPEEHARYDVVFWKSVNTASWNGDQTLPVLGSEN